MGRKKRGPIDQFTGLDLPERVIEKMRKEANNLCTFAGCKRKHLVGYKMCRHHRKIVARKCNRWEKRHPGGRKKEYANRRAKIKARFQELVKRGFKLDVARRLAAQCRIPLITLIAAPESSATDSNLN